MTSTPLRYKIERKLGEGYMGEVYLAKDTKYNRQVALKFLPARFTSDDDIQRFRQESFINFSLNHPNIVHIYDFEENVDAECFAGSGYQPQQERVYFIVDEFIEGKNLREYLSGKQLSPSEALRIAIEIAKALKQAHSKGIIHRDVKPDNVMITADGNVKVLDFGMAKLMDWFVIQQLSQSGIQHMPTVVTGDGEVLGTAVYMSPEQWGQIPRDGGTKLDERTDIWSLGVVLYEMLTGTNPFLAHTKDGVKLLIATYRPPPLGDHLGKVPRDLQKLVSRALGRDRGDRYRNIEEMLASMERLKYQVEGTTSRHSILLVVLVVMIILAAIVVARHLYF